ncbi:hypothetical protein ABIA30_004456 [Mycobacterium sp. MAA66]
MNNGYYQWYSGALAVRTRLGAVAARSRSGPQEIAVRILAFAKFGLPSGV